MRRFVLVVVVGLLAFVSTAQTETTQNTTFTWFGQASFLITTPQGTKILIDPVNMKDYQVPRTVAADFVTVSHNHFDHNQVDSLAGNPPILWGKTSAEEDDSKQQFIPVDTTIKGVHIYNVCSFHHDTASSPTTNAIFVYEFDNLRVVHLGDLGMTLDSSQLGKIGRVDVLMIPVGGKYTIMGAKADSVVAQLKPTRAIIPMHFKTRVADFLLASAEDFVKAQTEVERIEGNEYTLRMDAPSAAPRYIVFECFK